MAQDSKTKRRLRQAKRAKSMAHRAMVEHQKLRHQVTILDEQCRDLTRREFLMRKLLMATLLQNGEQELTRGTFQEACNDDSYTVETTTKENAESVMIVRLKKIETETDPLEDGTPAEIPERQPEPEPMPVDPTDAAMDPA